MEQDLAGRPQVVVAKAEAKAVVVRVEARAPPQELPKVLAELVAQVELVAQAELVARVELVAQVGSEQANVVEMMTTMTMTPTNAGKQGIMGSRPDNQWPVNNPENRVWSTLRSTGIWHLCTSLAGRREPS